MTKNYFTFGISQSLGNHYVVIEAQDSAEARRQMMAVYGTMWAFQYPEEDYDRSIARWNLTEIPFGTPNLRITED